MAGFSGEAKWADKEVFTTGEAAEICQVSQQTIIRCFDRGSLRGSRIPGSRFRRIPRAELVRFMKANQIPTGALESTARRILLVDDDENLIDRIRRRLEADDRLDIETAASGFDAGVLTERLRPHVLVLRHGIAHVNAAAICQRLRSDPHLSEVRIVILSSGIEPDELEKLTAHGADEIIEKPVRADQLLARIEELLGL